MGSRKPIARAAVVERNSPYGRRLTQKPAEASPSHHTMPSPPSWDAQKGNSDATPPLSSVSGMAPRLAPKASPPMSPIPPSLIHIPSKSSTPTTHMSTYFDAEENRRQKLKSKRDRQKQYKEDDYAFNPDVVQVVEEYACKRCKSQHWKCYISADPLSPRHTCLPCGKNKCTFGGSKTRPPTHPPHAVSVDDIFNVQRPGPNPMHERSYHAPASGPHLSHPPHTHSMTPMTRAHSDSHRHSGAQPQRQGFGHHRSNSGHMHAHPPPLHIRPLASPFPSPPLTTPELSPSVTDTVPSPGPRTPMDGYFFSRPREPIRAPVSAARDYQEDVLEMEMEADELHAVDDERSSSGRSTPWWPGQDRQSVIHYLSSDHLRPIPLPSPAEILGEAAAAETPLQRVSTPLSSPPTSPRHHAHSLSVQSPSSPHCPPSPLFPPTPRKSDRDRDLDDLTLPPLRSDTLPISMPHRNSLSISVSALSLSPMPSLPSLSGGGGGGSSSSWSLRSSPDLPAACGPPPLTDALLSILLETAARAPDDPRPMQVASNMHGVSEKWVSQINEVRRRSLGSQSQSPSQSQSQAKASATRNFDAYAASYDGHFRP